MVTRGQSFLEFRIWWLAGFLVLLCGAEPVHADGFQFPGLGAEALGRGGAVVADARDWTAIYWNPARLPYLEGERGELSFELIQSHFTSRDDNSIATSPIFQLPPVSFPANFQLTELNGIAHLPAAGGATRLNDRAALGFGVYAPLLNGVDFLDTLDLGPMGLTGVFDTELYNLVFNGSVGFELTDSWSIGGGLNVVYSDLSLVSTQKLSGLVDIEQSLELDGNGFGLEGQAGVAFLARDDLRFGATFRSGAETDIQGNAVVMLTGLVDATSDFTFPFRQPAVVVLGAAWDVRPGFSLSFDWQRTFWNDFQNGIDFSDPLIPDIENTAAWQDSNRYRVGFLLAFNERQRIAWGYYYAERAADAPDFTGVTDGNLHHVTFNYSHDFSRVGLDVGVLTGGGSYATANNETFSGGTQLNLGFRYRW